MEYRMILQYVFPVVAIVAAIAESYFDANKDVIEHRFSAVIRVVIAVVLSMSLFTFKVYYILIYTALLLNCFWVVFDPMYNFWRGNNLWYIGNTSALDRFVRKRFKEEGGDGYMIFKLVLMVFLLMFYSL